MIKVEELSFDSRDGVTKLHGVRWIPDSQPVAILQIVHGMQEYIARYDEFARFLAQKGILVVGHDHMGHGESANGQLGHFCENDPATVLVRDVHRLKKMTQQEYPTLPYLILGHSMGSFILRNYLTMYGTGIQGAIICGTGTPNGLFLHFGKLLTSILMKVRGPKYRSKLVAELTFGNYLKHIKNLQSRSDWLSTDRKSVEAFETDPLCRDCKFSVCSFHALSELGLRMTKKENIEKIPKKLPVFIVSGAEDAVGAYGKDPQELYDMYLRRDMSKVTIKLYPGLRHEILHEKIKESVYMDFYNWICMVITYDFIK